MGGLERSGLVGYAAWGNESTNWTTAGAASAPSPMTRLSAGALPFRKRSRCSVNLQSEAVAIPRRRRQLRVGQTTAAGGPRHSRRSGVTLTRGRLVRFSCLESRTAPSPARRLVATRIFMEKNRVQTQPVRETCSVEVTTAPRPPGELRFVSPTRLALLFPPPPVVVVARWMGCAVEACGQRLGRAFPPSGDGPWSVVSQGCALAAGNNARGPLTAEELVVN